ncbi:MAG: hypothetical protein ACE5FS_05645 [Paracoccaceae bacterium]
MTEKKMKIFVDVRPATVLSVYEKKLKPKLIKALGKSAKTALSKSSAVTLSKPSGWKKEKDKGFVLNITLVALTKKVVKKEIFLSAEVKTLIAHMKNGLMVRKMPVGTTTVKISATQKKIDGDAIFSAEHAIATVIKKDLVPLMQKTPMPKN